MQRVLIAGVSTRAAAESAARAGFAVTAIDAFADLDQHPSVQAQSLAGVFSPDAASRLAGTGGRAVPLGVFRQLIGEEPFGASGYRYCGNILAAAGEDDAVAERACAVAGAVCEAFGLVGVNGIDFVEKGGVPHAIEVNPRWSA